ncbi:MAG: hypothetical protein HYY93_05015 [Planctomycetes bacterium]|nr:hypothetical protein [Planctomycetota bacterium]
MECAAEAALALMIAFVVFAGAAREARAQTSGPGGIVVIGVNLAGQWDFDMTVLNASDPAMIGRTFTGAFAVTGGVPTYSGSGTFNGLPATISGNGSIDPSDGTTIVLSDHIATTDSATTFTATLMSGDYYSGVFDGGTVDGLSTWEGVFKLTITPPQPQPPGEQIESAFQTASRNVSDAVALCISSIGALAATGLQAMDQDVTRPTILSTAHDTSRQILELRRSTVRYVHGVPTDFALTARSIVSSAPHGQRASLSRLAAARTSELALLVRDNVRFLDDYSRDAGLLLQQGARDRLKPPKLIRFRNQGHSKHRYPDDTGETKPLGKFEDFPEGGIGSIGHPFEITWPTSTEDCSQTHIRQFVKGTTQNGATVVKKPDPGGYDADHYEEDVTPDGTVEQASRDNGDGTKSYVDFVSTDGVDPTLPFERHTKFRIELYCLENGQERILECIEFELTIVRGVKGKPDQNSMSAPVQCGG